MSSTTKRIAKNTGWLYIKMILSIFVSLYTTRIILKCLGADNFGIYNIVGGTIAMLGFLNASMASATQRFMSYTEGTRDSSQKKTIFNVSIILHFFVSILLALLLIAFGYIFFNGILNIPSDRVGAAKIIYICLIVSTCLTVLSVPFDAAINSHEDMKFYAIIGVIESCFKLAIAFACVYINFDTLIIYGVLTSIVPLFVLLLLMLYCYNHYNECRGISFKYFDKDVFVRVSKFASWNLFSSMSSMISQYGMGLLLNHYFGVLLNAAQGIANQVSAQVTSFSSTMLKAFNPAIMKLEGAGDRNNMLYFSMMGGKFSFLIICLMIVPIIIEAETILSLWLENVPLWAVLFVRLQLIRSLIEQPFIPLYSAIEAEGNIGAYSRTKSLLNFLPLILTFWAFANNKPAYWLYIIWIISWSILGSIVTVYFAKKNCGMSIHTFAKMVIKPSFFVCASIFIVNIPICFFLDGSLCRLIIVSIISVITFILSALLFALTKNDRILIVSYLKKYF